MGVLLLIASAGGLNWLTNSTEFRLDENRVTISGLLHTSSDAVRSTIGLGSPPTSIFRLRTTDMEGALEALPAVARAEVRAVLPDQLVVEVTERQPVFVLLTPATDYLVDATGVLLNDAAAVAGSADGLPFVDDRRPAAGRDLQAGAVLPALELEAVLQLAALTPDLVGSGAAGLRVTVSQAEGFVLSTEPASWRAIFGFYTPTLRPPDTIARQVQCLRSLLGQGEASVLTVYLEPVDERCGTFDARPTPDPRATPSPEPSG